MRNRIKPMHFALQRVVGESGMAHHPHLNICGKMVMNAWTAAISKGWVRRIHSDERDAWIDNRRAVRDVLLAMLTDAALDEGRAVWQDTGKPTVADLGESLEMVLADITEAVTNDEDYWTLTDAGVAELAKLEGKVTGQ